MRILWVKTSPLHPLTRGGDLRTFQLLRELHQRHEITFTGMTGDAGQREGATQADAYSTRSFWTHEPKCSLKAGRLRFAAGAVANLFSNVPYAAQRFTSKRWRDQISRILDERPFDVILCDFLFPAASLPWDKKKPAQAWVLFQHNVECMIWKRRAAERTGVPGLYFKSQWQRMAGQATPERSRGLRLRLQGRLGEPLELGVEWAEGLDQAATCQIKLRSVSTLQAVGEQALDQPKLQTQLGAPWRHLLEVGAAGACARGSVFSAGSPAQQVAPRPS